MANFTLDISGALSTAWEYAKKYGLLIAVVYLLLGILTSGLQSIGGSSFSMQDSQAIGEAIGRGDWDSVGNIAQAYSGSVGSNFGTMIGSIITAIVSVGLYNLALGLMGGRFN